MDTNLIKIKETKTNIMSSKNLIFVLFLAFAMPLFAQDADMSLIPYRKGDLWGYASPDKKIVIQPEYAEANFFYAGLAVVKKGDKYGYINKAGKVVIPFKFFLAKSFRFGYIPKTTAPLNAEDNNQKEVLFAGAALLANGYEICINTKGEKLLKCPAINENSVPELNKPNTVTIESNYSTIQKSELFDKINTDYKMPGVEETFYVAIRNNKIGVFNNKFEVIVPFEYDKIEKLSIGIMVYLLVEKNGLKGMLFGNGSPYMSVENTKLLYVKTTKGINYFIFTKDGKTGLKDSRYQMLAEPIYNDIVYLEDAGFVVTSDNNKKGFLFLNNNLLEAKYADIKTIKSDEYVMLKQESGKWGYVSSNFVEFFED